MPDWLIDRCRMIARPLSWAGAVAIIVLTVIPAAERPVTGAGSSTEHVAAFALVAGVFAIGYRLHLVTRLTIALLFCAGIELLQMPLPTRHARLSDLIVDFAASSFAIAVVAAAERLTDSRRSPKG